ncbi:polymorphic toxin-type HINT domain-containing protein [Aliikangiella sp. G2MR2-5]|uniref:polymorphic toxin-type HINT domain-containing protein n=1 Tax=Aliikangiella sp. G2MR2-5 TaxID=2788943 RepID=UPI0018A8F0ED|nr:polymorphic toxin-type HINT domain-containing protein [Aliikangiella sp. G2MR2-5]
MNKFWMSITSLMLLAASGSVSAFGDPYINITSCQIPQNSAQTTCSIQVSWHGHSVSTGFSEDDLSPIDRPPCLYYLGESQGCKENGSITLNVSAGAHTFNLKVLGQVNESQALKSTKVLYEAYAKPFNWSGSTHTEITGDFNGDQSSTFFSNGNLDILVQPINKGDQTGLFPQSPNDQYISPYHRAWSTTHSDIPQIEDWSQESYGIFVGNFNSNPGDELLMLGKKKIIMLHGDIVTPIVTFPAVNNAIVSWNANRVAQMGAFEFDASPDNFEVVIGDLTGDGFDEIFLQGKSKGATSYILSNTGELVQTLENGFLNIDWSAAAYKAVISGGSIQLTALTSADDDNVTNHNSSGAVTSLQTPVTKPEIFGSPKLYYYKGSQYEFTPSTIQQATLLFDVAGEPDWMEQDKTTGRVSGTTLNSQGNQNYVISIIAIEDKNYSVPSSMSFNLAVLEAFTIEEKSYQVYVDNAGNIYLVASDGNAYFRLVKNGGQQWLEKITESEFNNALATLTDNYKYLFKDFDGDGSLDLIIYDENFEEQSIAITSINSTEHSTFIGNPFEFVIADSPLDSQTVPEQESIGALEGGASVSGGASTYNIPIAIPPGRNGIQPNVSLSYSSRGGNGIAGIGWSLNASSNIHRCAATTAQDGFTSSPQFDSSRDRLCIDGQKLILVEGSEYGVSGAKYKSELDSFITVTQHGNINGSSTYFLVVDKQGKSSWYGDASKSANSFQKLENKSMALTWAISKTQDLSGNNIFYYYNYHGKGEYTLRKISYTGYGPSEGDRHLLFEYENRVDSEGNTDYRTSYLAGGKSRITKRLKSIKTLYKGTNIRKYSLVYGKSSLSSGRTLLRSVQECANNSGWKCLPETSFEWQEAAPKYVLEPVEFNFNGSTVAANVADKISWVVPKADIDGDGVRDWPGLDTNSDNIPDVAGYMVNAEGQVTNTHMSPTDGCFVRANLKFGKQCLTVDFNQDGKTDFFKLSDNTSGEFLIKLNGSSSWVTAPFSLEFYQDKLINISDYNGDGWPDVIVQLVESQWELPKLYVYPHTKNNSQPYTTASRLFLFQLSQNDPSVLFEYAEQVQVAGDMDGNGMQDLLISLLPRPGENQPGMPYPDRLILFKNSTGGQLQYDTYEFSDYLVPQDSLNLGDAHFFHDINGDGLDDWLSMNSGNSQYWLEAKLNTGGAFTGNWINLGVNVPTRVQFYYHTSGEPEGYVFPVIEKTMSMDYNGDGKAELLFASDVVASACSLVFHFQPGSTARIEEYMCDDELWGNTYFNSMSNRRSPIDGNRKDVSARNFKAIYFDEALDGSISTRVEDTDIVAASVERIALDATGNGLTDVVTTFECQIEGCAWNTESQQYGGKVVDPSLVANRIYINRNIGASPSDNGYEAIDVIKRVNQGLGVVDEWTYRPLGSDEYNTDNGDFYKPDHDYVSGDIQSNDQAYFHFGSSMMVVAEHRSSSGIAHEMNPTQYKYRGAVFNNQGRGFQGFRTIIVDSPSKLDENGNLEFLRSVTDFHQKFPKSGKIEEIRTCIESNNDEYCENDKLNHQSITYHIKNTATESNYWIVPKEETNTHYPLEGGARYLSRTMNTIAFSDLDNYGNIKKVVSDINSAFNTVTITKEFDFDTTNPDWRNKLNFTTVQYETKTGFTVHDSTLDPIKKTKSTFTWTNERLPDLITTESLLPVNDSSKTIVVDTDYNAYGLPTTVSTYELGHENEARVTSTQYSNNGLHQANDGYFPFELTNSEGHKTKITSAPVHGQPLSVTQNGVTSWTEYDAFGRVEEVIPPTNTGQTTYKRYSNCSGGCDGIADSNVRYKITTYQVGTPVSTVYMDMFNRAKYSRVEGFDGTISYTKVIYNRLGQKVFESIPSLDIDEVKGVSFGEYDLLGRPLTKSISQPYDQSMEVTYSYEQHTTNIIVSGGSKVLNMSRIHSGDGKLVQTTQNDGTQDIVTQYAYDAMGNPIVLQDAKGNSIRAKYNALGQKDFVDDPNMGVKYFTYTPFGEVYSESDANGDVYYYLYDDLGRLTYRYLNQEPTANNFNLAEAFFSYDAQCEGAIDTETRLDLIEGESFSKEYLYDSFCRPSETITNIDGSSYKTKTFYDGNYGRVKGVLYPNNLLVETQYNAKGFATKTQNPLTGYVYHEVTNMDVRGNVLSAKKANGVLAEGFEYWAETGQMKTVYAQTENGGQQRHRIEYTYDSFGNLETQTVENMRSSVITSIESYTYDDLHRLKNSTRVVNGVSLADINYDYDVVGNLLLKDDYANNYIYGNKERSSGNAGPNAVYSIEKVGVGTQTYTYDNNGNLLTGDAKSLSYNAQNKPVSISRNGITSDFYYGSDHMRYKQVKKGKSLGDEVTLYIGKTFEIISYAGETQKKLYLGDTIITDTLAGGLSTSKMSFVHRDRLGSVVTITDENGDVVDNRSYDPFGKPRKGTMEDVQPATLRDVAYQDNFISVVDDLRLETRRGYTDHEHLDDAQLIHMNGRVYDYNLGRFLSVDPFIQSPGNSQSMNPYSYVLNNPLVFKDPSGYFREPGESAAHLGLMLAVATGGISAENAQKIADFESAVGNHALQGAAENGETIRVAIATGSVEAAIIYVAEKAKNGEIGPKGKRGKNKNTQQATQNGHKNNNQGTTANKTDSPENTESQSQVNKQSNTGGCSFIAGTLVATPLGFREIQDLKAGDLVKAKNDQTDEVKDKKVNAVFDELHKEVIELTIKLPDGKIEVITTTAEHPFMLYDGEWLPAGELEVGAFVETIGGLKAEVVGFEIIKEQQVAYNFEVDEFHTYAVGEGELWVHNECGDDEVRVRHYTNKSSADKIKEDGTIKASDNNRVYFEDAKKKPLSPKKAEAKHKIKEGKGNSYVETNVKKSDIEMVKNPLTGKKEMTVKGDVKLKDEEVVNRK